MAAGESAYIRKLRERIRENPGSKLFLSLAEELKKLCRLEDAFSVLTDGIRKDPGFIAPQLTLGRWYLSCDMFAEAKREFSEALGKSPGNAFAQKGLAEAGRNLGVAGAEEPGPEAAEEEAGPEELEPVDVQEELRADPAPGVASLQPSGLPESRVAGLLSEAEACIATGKYRGAMRIYDELLASLGDDPRIRQKKEELALLIKLAGRDRETVIARLNRFSSLVDKRFAERRTRRKEIAADRLDRLSGAIRNRFAQKFTASLPEGS